MKRKIMFHQAASIITLIALQISSQVRADSPLCLAGCANADINTKHFVEASEKLKEAAEELAKFDPIGIKSLLSNNEALQAKVNKVATQLSGYTIGDPVMVLGGQLVRFRVAHAVGNFRIKLWLDDPKRPPIVDRRAVIGQPVNLPLPTGAQVIEPLLAAFRRMPLLHNVSADGLDIKLAACRNLIDQQNTLVQQRFTEYLTNTQPVPLPAVADIDLNQTLMKVGEHNLFVEVTPVATDTQGRWAFEGQIVISRPGAGDLLPMVFAFDNTDPAFKNHPLNSVLPAQRLYFAVK